IKVSADDGGSGEHMATEFGEPAETTLNRRADTLRQRQRLTAEFFPLFRMSVTSKRVDDFSDKERVAAGFLKDRRHQRSGRRPCRAQFDEAGDLAFCKIP